MPHVNEAQSFYYVRGGSHDYFIGYFDIVNCKDSSIVHLDFANYSYPYGANEIAIGPDGSIYLRTFDLIANGTYLAKVNVQTGGLTNIYTLPSVTFNSLTCDANGILYLAGPSGIYTYNTVAGQGGYLGSFPYTPSGDLTFRNGKLYCTCNINKLVEVNLDNPAASQVVFSYPLSPLQSAWGIVSFVVDCDSTDMYMTVANNTLSEWMLYRLDFESQQVIFLCNTPSYIYGAAAAQEFIASDCSVRVDLDTDDSSGAAGSDFRSPPACSSQPVAVCDSDAVFYSGYRLDSMRVRILAPADAPAEYLTAQIQPAYNLSGQGTPWLTVATTAGSALAANNTGLRAALQSVRWHDDASPRTPGQRTIEVIAFASGGRSDTAFAYIPVPPALNAGSDTTLFVCPDALPFDLAAALSTDATPGGAWSPSTTTGNHTFQPGTDTDSVYVYVVADGICPADSAVVAIRKRLFPVFSLGNDASFCTGSQLILDAPAPALWQDGSVATNYTVSQPGLYWAEVTDSSGCKWRDSITAAVLQPVFSQSSATPCAGQPYILNGVSFTTDTTVCTVYTGFNGCDSTDCLALSFFYPLLTLDTSICSGQSISLSGNVYSSSGIYDDTLLVDGCLTRVVLQLDVSPPDTFSLHAVVCDGQTFSAGGMVFTDAGQYTLPLQTPQGCDSIVMLSLSVLPRPQTTISAGLCPGDSLYFNGIARYTPGIYADTVPSVNGCDSIVHLNLYLLPQPQPHIDGSTIVCEGDKTLLSVSGFSAVEWSGGTGGPTLDAGPGIHAVTVTDANGCRGADTIAVTGIPPIEAVWDSAAPRCPGATDGFISLAAISGGVQPFHFQLNNNVASDTGNFENLGPGDWNVTVTDDAGCQRQYHFSFSAPTAPLLEWGPVPVLDADEPFLLPLSISPPGNYLFHWSPTEGLSCDDCPNPLATIGQSATFFISLTDENGCITSDSIKLRVLEKSPSLYAPTVFSPDNNGENDYFTLFGDPEAFSRIGLLRVFDRWGGLVFEGLDLPLNEEHAGWDGKCRGKTVPSGVYCWFATLHLASGTILFKSGDVTVVR